MARKPILAAAVVSVFLLSGSSAFLQCQQSNLQTSFFAPASVRIPNIGVAADIVESEHLPYINQVAKDAKPAGAVFRPNTFDLLIQQAEERFRNGKNFYRDRDLDHARIEFDAAIDLMLRAAENPTDPALFQSKLEDMVDTIHNDDVSGMGAAVVDEVPGFDKSPLDDIVNMTFPIDPRTKEKVQTEVKLTTSALPLVVNDTVLGYINYFNGRGHKTIEGAMERAGKYEAMISRVLREEGIPQELIHVAQAESGFLPRAVSRAAAEGMWQFVKFRGNQYGLMQTPYSDDRLDPEKATRAAAHHLHDLYDEFGDWYLAMAAYNSGPGTIERAVERSGYADFWELRARRMIPVETSNYVPIILAMTIMAKNAAAYGLDRITPEAPIEYDTIMTSSPTSLALVADLSDTSVAQILQLNPALLRSVAPGNFELRVPKGIGPQVGSALGLVPAERRASWRMPRVEPGQTLASIARRYNSSPSLIASTNKLNDTEPMPGDRLLVPVSDHETAAPARRARPAVRKVASAALTRTPAAHARTTASSARPAAHRTAGTLAQLHSHPSTP
jgi:membrane-bound lytic murein transglycosylase D